METVGCFSSKWKILQLMKVEEVVSSRIEEPGGLFYEVKWVNNWVPEKLLQDSFTEISSLIEKFEQKQQQLHTTHKEQKTTDANPQQLTVSNVIVDDVKQEDYTNKNDGVCNDIEGIIFMCDICNNAFSTHTSLSAHKKRCSVTEAHSAAINKTLVSQEGNSNNRAASYDEENCSHFNRVSENELSVNAPSSNAQFQHCSSTFDNSEHLTRRTQTAHQEGGEVSSSSLCCQRCSTTFDTEEDFYSHVSVHETQDCTIYECENCRMTFADAEYLSRHMVRCKNQALSNFRCDVCQRGFTTKGSLDLHVDAVHLKKKEFGCSLCGRLFSRKHILKVHLATHYGKRDFVCGTCGKKFLQKGNLNRHERIHLSKNFGYKCRYCGQTFTQNKHLQKHLQTLHNFKNEESQ